MRALGLRYFGVERWRRGGREGGGVVGGDDERC